jgi:ABC-type uncharacterized transport system permease subunit
MEWAALLTVTFLSQLLASSIRLATPLVLAAIGEIFTERSGVIDLGLEGIMLFSGFVGFSVAFQMGSLWVGVIAGMIIGSLMGLLFAFMVITLRANQVVTGLTLMVLGTGLATYFQRLGFKISELIPLIKPFHTIAIPVLSDIPIIGSAFFNQTPFTYLMYALVPIALILFNRTPFGLRINVVGESPQTADALGVNVAVTRYICIIIGGVLAGLAGAFYPLAELGVYADSMIGGRGFIVLALVVFGRWDPFWALAGGLLFGGVDALQNRLQTLGSPIPSYFLLMTPYILTIFVLLVGRRRKAPTALGTPYVRE